MLSSKLKFLALLVLFSSDSSCGEKKFPECRKAIQDVKDRVYCQPCKRFDIYPWYQETCKKQGNKENLEFFDFYHEPLKQGLHKEEVTMLELENNTEIENGKLTEKGIKKLFKTMDTNNTLQSFSEGMPGNFSGNIYKVKILNNNTKKEDTYFVKEPKIFTEEERKKAERSLQESNQSSSSVNDLQNKFTKMIMEFKPKTEVNAMISVYQNKNNECKKALKLPFQKAIFRINRTKKYLIVMKAAEGVPLVKKLKDYLEDKYEAEKLIADFTALGHAIGCLHRSNSGPKNVEIKDFTHFKTKSIHGDLHFGNIFIDSHQKESKESKVTFIDISGMAESIENPKSPKEDFDILSLDFCHKIMKELPEQKDEDLVSQFFITLKNDIFWDLENTDEKTEKFKKIIEDFKNIKLPEDYSCAQPRDQSEAKECIDAYNKNQKEEGQKITLSSLKKEFPEEYNDHLHPQIERNEQGKKKKEDVQQIKQAFLKAYVKTFEDKSKKVVTEWLEKNAFKCGD